jgi:hypothetical protein
VHGRHVPTGLHSSECTVELVDDLPALLVERLRHSRCLVLAGGDARERRFGAVAGTELYGAAPPSRPAARRGVAALS